MTTLWTITALLAVSGASIAVFALLRAGERKDALIIGGMTALFIISTLIVLCLREFPGAPQDPAESSVCEESEAPTPKPIKVIIGYPAHAGTLDETENDESSVFVAETYEREQEEQAPRFVMSADNGGFVYRETYFDKRTGRNERIQMPYEWQFYAYECAQRHNVSFDLVLAVMGMESSFDVFIGSRFDKNGNEYYGPGMVSVRHTEEYLAGKGVNLCTVEGGIEAVAIILADKLDEYGGNVTNALLAYNCGSAGANAKISKGVTSTPYTDRVFEILQGLSA